MRIRGATTELADAGEEIDKYCESTATMRKEIKALSGVDILEADGETFRSTYDIMVDIAKVWDDLTDTNRASLLEALAGKRNASVVKSIITNIDDLTGSYKTAQEAMGAVDKANSIYLDSIEGRMAQFVAQLQEFAAQIVNTDFFKGIISGGTVLLSILQGILTFGDGIITKLLLVVAFASLLDSIKILGFFKALSSSMFIAQVSSDGLLLALARLNAEGFMGAITAIPRLIIGLIALSAQSSVATVASQGLRAALMKLNINPTMLAINAFILALTSMVLIFNACTTSTKEYAERLEKSGSELADIKSKIESLNSELATTKQRIIELQSKDSLTIVEQNELDKLQSVNAELERKLALEKQNKITTAKAVSKDFADTISSWRNDRQGGTLLLPGSSSMSGLAPKFEEVDILTHYWKQYKTTTNQEEKDEAYAAIEKKYKQLSAYKDMLKEAEYEHLSTDAQEAYDYISDFENKLLLMSNNTSDIETVFSSVFYSEKYTKGREALEELGKQGVVTAEQISELFSQNNHVKEMLTYMQELGLVDINNSGFEQFAKQLNDMSGIAEDEIVATTKTFDELNTAIDNIQKAYNAANTAIKEYNETGYLSIDNLQSLLELDDKYLKALIDENGQLVANADAYKQLMLAELQELELQQVESILKSVTNLSLESAQAYATAQAIDAENESRQDLIQTMIEQAVTEARIKNFNEGTTAYTDAISAAIPVIAKRLALIRETEKAITDEAESTKEALEQERDALQKRQELLEDAKSDIQDLIDLVTDMITKEKELEKEVLEKQKEDFDEIIEKRKEALELQKEELEISRELADKQNAVAKNALAASIAELDDSGAGRKARKEANDALTESRTDLSDYLYDREYNLRIESLDKLKESTDKFYDKQIDTIEEYLDNERQLYEDACKMIDEHNGELYGKLLSYVQTYTTKTDSEFQHLWSSAVEAIDKYGDKNISVASLANTLNGEILKTQDTIDTLDTKIKETESTIKTISNSIGNGLSGGIDNAKVSLEKYKSIVDELKGYINNGLQGEWAYVLDGKIYTSNKTERDKAAMELSSKISKDIGSYIPYESLYAHMKDIPHYASGTRSAKGGLSKVGEKGAELRILNQGDGIIPANITANLMAIGENPAKYFRIDYERIISSLTSSSMISDTLKTMFGNVPSVAMATDNTPQNVAVPVINITIQGDATQSTVNALRAQADNIVKRAVNETMTTALKYSNVPKRR